MGDENMGHFLTEVEDVRFEEELSRSPYSVKLWWQYIQAKHNKNAKDRNLLYERALKVLPGSYKLWHAYLNDRQRQIRRKCPTDKAFEALINVYERALVFMNKMPVIWIEFCKFLMGLHQITRTRHTFDRALQALPITQHKRVWPMYISFIRGTGIAGSAIRVYRRFLMYDPTQREEFVDYLLEQQHYNEAAEQLALIVNDPNFSSQVGRSKHETWMQLCEILSKHPDQITGLKPEPIIRSGIRKFSDEVGRLWCALADYFIRLGQFERARDLYEEGCQTVMTVRDFTMIFDAYAQFEETMVTAKMEAVDDEEEDEEDDLDEDGNDIELRLQRLANLMDRRPVMLSSVLLRQNPHNVNEWLNRVSLFEGDPSKVIVAYTEACKTVDPSKAVGRFNQIWCDFARYYEKHGDIDNAREIFRRGTQVPYRASDDLASVWCEWAEMEVRNGLPKKAIELLQEATKAPPKRRRTSDAPVPKTVQSRLYRAVKVWALYVDLEESFGTLETAKAAYNRCIELKVATPLMVLNFAQVLEDRHYFEDSFKVYEMGVAAFNFPHVQEIWLQYLTKFVERYGGRKLERARDLFEQAVENVPKDIAKLFYALYADLEERFGLVRHMMAVYDRATRAVAEKDRYRMYLRYIRKTEEYFGVTRTREIYERAVETLPDHQIKDICLRFAEMERQLGEIDRARAVFQHASQYCDPRTVVTFWKEWKNFEIAHGNEDTFRDMFRVRRSVQAQYSQVNYMVAEMSNTEKILTDAEAFREMTGGKPIDGPVTMSSNAGASDVAPRGTKRTAEEAGLNDSKADAGGIINRTEESNPEEIDLDADVDVQQREVPSAVFGDAKKLLAAQQPDAPKGALEMLKNKRARLG